MSETFSPSEPTTETLGKTFQTLPDPWAKNGFIPLDRYLERERFSPVLMAILVAIALFFLFQLIGGIVTILLVIPKLSFPPDATKLMKLLEDDVATQLIGNTIGQFLGMALPILLITKLHTTRSADFLRLRNFHLSTILWAILGLVVLYPTMMAVGMLNEMIPQPQALQEMDKLREKMIEMMLLKSNPFFNFLAIAVTPAICEELMFRGYIQRQFERSFRATTAIIVTGLIFGSFHLSFKQVLPLSFIGIYLCYLTWKTDSLYPAIFVHLFNNGISVVAAAIYTQNKSFDPTSLDKMPGPWYAVLTSVLVSLALFWLVNNNMNRITEARFTQQQSKTTNDYERLNAI